MRFSNYEHSQSHQRPFHLINSLPGTHFLHMGLHLFVREATQLGLEVPEVVDGATAVGRGDDIGGRLAEFVGDGCPGCLDGSD